MDLLRRLWGGSAPTATSDGPHLTSLPTELLHRILAVSDPKDVASARLTCRLLATIGAEHLLDSLRVLYTHSSFEEMKAIVSHAPIGKTIRKLEYNGDRMKRYDNVRDWLACTGLRFHVDRARYRHRLTSTAPLTKENVSEAAGEEIGTCYEMYDRSLQDEMNFARSGLDGRALELAFKQCPKLRDVTLIYGHTPASMRKRFRKAFPEDYAEPSGDRHIMKAGAHDLQIITSAAHDAGVKLRYLTADGVGPEIFDQLETTHLDVLNELRTLRLNFALDNNDLSQREDERDVAEDIFPNAASVFQKGTIKRTLAGMPHLRKLRLRLPMCEAMFEHDLNICADLADVAGLTTWPQLRDLGIASCGMTEDYLVDLILRHKDTLQRVSLSYLVLAEGNWISVWTRVAGRCPKLKQFKLSGSFRGMDIGNPSERWSEWDFDSPGIDDPDKGRSESPRLNYVIERYIRKAGEPPNWEDMQAHQDDLEWRCLVPKN